MTLQALLFVYALLLGLIVGSYLNVVIYRLPRGISTVLPRSACPHCGAVIRVWDNLPILSFLLLGGRCRHCRARIAWRYPVVELTSGLAFVACFARFGFGVEFLVASLFCAAMIALAAIDLEHYILPDRITLPGIAAGWLLQPWIPGVSLRAALLGAVLGAAILWTVSRGWYLLRREEGMGLGDVKMLAMIGAFLGVEAMLVTLFVSFLTGAVVGLVLLALRQGALRSRLPFGAFLAPAAVFSLFWGRSLADLYLGLL